MIHTFTYQNDYFVLDTESGAIHTLDKPAYDVLRCMEEGTDPLAALSGKYETAEISEIMEEAEQLKNEGLLFCEDLYDHSKPVFNDPVIKSLCLHIAHDCNLRCAYCFGEQGSFFGEKALMSLDTAKKSLDFLMKMSGKRKHLEVDFFGGEPLINFDVVKQAVVYGRELEKQYGKEIRFTLTTNAYHVTPEMAGFINREMKNLVISIDGRKETHDALRKTADGKGSFDKTLTNAKMLIEGRGDQEYYIRGTFTSRNLDFAEDALALADYGFEEISLEPVVTGGDMAIREEHLPQILCEYEKLADLYEQRRRGNRPFHFFHFTVDLSSGPCLNKRLRGCGAGSEYAAIAPNGDIYPCHQFVGKKDFLMGHIDTGVLDEQIREKFLGCHVWNKKTCRQCWAKYYCSGGCAANAYNMKKDMMQPHEIGCIMEKRRIELAIALGLRERSYMHETKIQRYDA